MKLTSTNSRHGCFGKSSCVNPYGVGIRYAK